MQLSIHHLSAQPFAAVATSRQRKDCNGVVSSRCLERLSCCCCCRRHSLGPAVRVGYENPFNVLTLINFNDRNT